MFFEIGDLNFYFVASDSKGNKINKISNSGNSVAPESNIVYFYADNFSGLHIHPSFYANLFTAINHKQWRKL